MTVQFVCLAGEFRVSSVLNVPNDRNIRATRRRVRPRTSSLPQLLEQVVCVFVRAPCVRVRLCTRRSGAFSSLDFHHHHRNHVKCEAGRVFLPTSVQFYARFLRQDDDDEEEDEGSA